MLEGFYTLEDLARKSQEITADNPAVVRRA